MGGNQKTWASEEEKIRAFQAKEEALKILGWALVDGFWNDGDCLPMTFEKACEKAGI